jgi:signal transduction protein with GAF and PtsI domain
MTDQDPQIQSLEIELRLANFKLEILQEITLLLTESLDPRQTLEFIMDRVFSLVEMEAASVLAYDETGEQLEFICVRGGKEDELTGFKMDATRGIAGKALAAGEPILLEDAATDPDFFQALDSIFGYKTTSLIAVPMKFAGRTLGVLEGVNIASDEVKSAANLIELFECLASLISMTLVTARLMDQFGVNKFELK